MSTYEEYLNIIRRFSPEIQSLFQQLWNGGRSLSPRELLRILYFILAAGPRDQIIRALILLGRLGRFSPGVVAGALELEAAGAGASVASGSSVATGAAAAGTAAAVAAVLAALISVAYAGYTITTEVLKEITFPDGGPLCQFSKNACSAGGEDRRLFKRGVGSKTAVQRAIDAAQASCESADSCCKGGSCPPGRICKPTASFIDIDPRWRLFWTTAHVAYRCTCQCVQIYDGIIPADDEYWNEFNWDDLTEEQKKIWVTLGWTMETWDAETGDFTRPDSASKSWNELSDEERKAANALGYNEETWNKGGSTE